MDESRRSFLKKLGCAAAAVGGSFPLLGALLPENRGSDASGASSQMGLVIDIQQCLDEKVRLACSEACHQRHNVPAIDDPEEEVKWLWSEDYENAFPDQAHARTAGSLKGKPVLVLCNHCENPACTKVCPTKATWKRESDGIVMMDMHRCIGCRYCMAACPYGARSFNWSDPREHLDADTVNPHYPTRTQGVVEKCNFCAERLRADLEPACVEAAREAVADATGGVSGDEKASDEKRHAPLTFGDLSDPNSDVSQLLDQKHTICRRLGLGTGPNVFYIADG